MRKVTIYSTIGNDSKEAFVSSTTWGDLQNELAVKQISASGMKVIIGESQLTLESNQAELPLGDFTLFFMPQKVKSGAWANEDDDDDFSVPTSNTPIGLVQTKILNIGNALNELYEMVSKLPSNGDPVVAKLQEKADQLKKNLGLFD
jgi:hypothetical protein